MLIYCSQTPYVPANTVLWLQSFFFFFFFFFPACFYHHYIMCAESSCRVVLQSSCMLGCFQTCSWVC